MVKKRLNIVFVAEVSHIGGASTSLEELANSFVKLGHSVYIIQGLDRDQKNLSRPFVSPKVEFLNYKVNFRTNILVYLSLLWGTLKSLSSLTKKQVDVLLLNGTFSAGVACLHPSFRKTKKIFLFHGDDVAIFKSINFSKNSSFAHRAKGFPFLKLLAISQKIALQKSRLVVCFSRYSQEYVLNNFKIPKNKLAFTYHGVDITFFRPAPKKALLKEKMGISAKFRIVLSTSRFEPRKAIEFLLESFATVSKKIPGCLLFLATSADEYFIKSPYYLSLIEKISKLGISSRVRIVHNLTRKELLPYYQIADTHVLSSKYLESLSLVVLEALSSGTPVCCYANSGGAPEVIKRLSPNLVFASYDPSSLAKSILWALKAKNTGKLAKNARTLAKKFQWGREASYFLKLFSQI